MDVALRVAEYVTMMHDGRMIVEGTPAEIRANQTRPRPLSGHGGTSRRRDRPTTPLLDGRGPRRVLRERAGARGRDASRWGASPSRSSAATAWARRRSATRSWASRRRCRRLDPVRGQGDRRRPVEQDRRGGIGYVPQGRRLFPSLSVDEHLRIASRSAAARRRAASGRAAGLRALPAARGAQAQRRRAALGRRAADARDRAGAADEPELLIMDEPSEGLAPAIIENLIETFREARAGGPSHPPDRAEPRRRDRARRAAADHGLRVDLDGDDRAPCSPATPSCSAGSSASSRSPTSS